MIFLVDLLRRRKIGKYHQNINDISTHSDKSLIFEENCLPFERDLGQSNSHGGSPSNALD